MTRIPASALTLGLAGALPFLGGAWLSVSLAPPGAGDSFPYGPESVRQMLIAYGTIVHCFMSGVLWGFSAQGPREGAWIGYTLSVVPALFAFFVVTPHMFSLAGSSFASLIALALGFLAVLLLDWLFSARDLTPLWWLPLRTLLTAIVVPCLLIAAYA
jgi:hypothetical protein